MAGEPGPVDFDERPDLWGEPITSHAGFSVDLIHVQAREDDLIKQLAAPLGRDLIEVSRAAQKLQERAHDHDAAVNVRPFELGRLAAQPVLVSACFVESLFDLGFRPLRIADESEQSVNVPLDPVEFFDELFAHHAVPLAGHHESSVHRVRDLPTQARRKGHGRIGVFHGPFHVRRPDVRRPAAVATPAPAAHEVEVEITGLGLARDVVVPVIAARAPHLTLEVVEVGARPGAVAPAVQFDDLLDLIEHGTVHERFVPTGEPLTLPQHFPDVGTVFEHLSKFLAAQRLARRVGLSRPGTQARIRDRL